MNDFTEPSFALPIGCPSSSRARRVPRLGIGDVDRVVFRDRDAARPAELRPLVEKLAVLIEDLDAVVVAIADKEAAARVQGNRVRHVEFAGP